jgi:alpha-amylase
MHTTWFVPLRTFPPLRPAHESRQWDLGEFDQKGARSTRWGTKDELLALSTAAAKCRIDILIDAVLNVSQTSSNAPALTQPISQHKLGADRPEACLATPVDPADRHRDLGPTREVEVRASNHRPSPRNSWTVWIWSGFDFPGREGKYSSLTWSHEHFTGVDYDARTKTTGVFRLAGHPHQGWSPWVDKVLTLCIRKCHLLIRNMKENGNYDYLLGIDVGALRFSTYRIC